MNKSILASKTIWVNLVAVGASFVGSQFGFTIDAEAQIAILGVINLVLRAVTKGPVVWK